MAGMIQEGLGMDVYLELTDRLGIEEDPEEFRHLTAK